MGRGRACHGLVGLKGQLSGILGIAFCASKIVFTYANKERTKTRKSVPAGLDTQTLPTAVARGPRNAVD